MRKIARIFRSRPRGRAARLRRSAIEAGNGKKVRRIGSKTAAHRRTRIFEIGAEQLFDQLSEALMLSKSSTRLMELARDRAQMTDVREMFERFITEAERSRDELTAVVRDLGGNPGYVSPAAETQRDRAEAALQLAAPAGLQALCDVESAWYAALQENTHLAFLRSIVPYLSSPSAHDLLEGALDRIHREQEERLEWLQRTLYHLLFQRAVSGWSGNDWYRAA